MEPLKIDIEEYNLGTEENPKNGKTIEVLTS